MLRRRLGGLFGLNFPAMAGGGGSYAEKILGYSPIAYWPLWEAAGGVANDISGNGFHGAYTGVTLGQTGIGDGNTCPLFDGATSFVNVYSPGFRDAWDGDEFTVALWCTQSNWGGGAVQYVMNFLAGGNDFTRWAKFPANTLLFEREGNNTRRSYSYTPYSEAGFFHLAMTASITADEQIHYLNGVQIGATINGLVGWVGALGAGTTVIGAQSTVPANEWDGKIAHGAVFDSAQSPAAMLDMATV